LQTSNFCAVPSVIAPPPNALPPPNVVDELLLPKRPVEEVLFVLPNMPVFVFVFDEPKVLVFEEPKPDEPPPPKRPPPPVVELEVLPKSPPPPPVFEFAFEPPNENPLEALLPLLPNMLPEFVLALFPPKSEVPDCVVFVLEPNRELPVFPNPPDEPNPLDPNPDF
jgi:hypothetical protein